MALSALQKARYAYTPKLPPALRGDVNQITVQLGARSTQTTSTSRRELTTLIFELAGRALPDWSQPEYRGYPLITAHGRRSAVVAASYGITPLAFLIIGLLLTRARRRG